MNLKINILSRKNLIKQNLRNQGSEICPQLSATTRG